MSKAKFTLTDPTSGKSVDLPVREVLVEGCPEALCATEGRYEYLVSSLGRWKIWHPYMDSR